MTEMWKRLKGVAIEHYRRKKMRKTRRLPNEKHRRFRQAQARKLERPEVKRKQAQRRKARIVVVAEVMLSTFQSQASGRQKLASTHQKRTLQM